MGLIPQPVAIPPHYISDSALQRRGRWGLNVDKGRSPGGHLKVQPEKVQAWASHRLGEKEEVRTWESRSSRWQVQVKGGSWSQTDGSAGQETWGDLSVWQGGRKTNCTSRYM